LTALFLATAVSGAGAQQAGSMLAPAGPQADSISVLAYWMFGVGAFVLALVTVLVLVAVLRGRRGERALDERRGMQLVIAGGVVLPLIVTAALLVGSVAVGRDTVGAPPAGALQLEVVGHQWWWEVHYLDGDNGRIATVANEIHVPVGRPVALRLKSYDVIHSFWAPNLQGKTDLIPGRENAAWFQVDAAGVYRGQCAEFCGTQHALMAFVIVAEPAASFDAWLAQQAAPAAAPADERARRGRQVFETRACVLCHAVRGTVAGGLVAPDLTHVASRMTLAAGRLPNDRPNLTAWILDPQGLKPGTRMPATSLSVEELEYLLHYLQGLH